MKTEDRREAEAKSEEADGRPQARAEAADGGAEGENNPTDGGREVEEGARRLADLSLPARDKPERSVRLMKEKQMLLKYN
jgi:hypothetical protein